MVRCERLEILAEFAAPDVAVARDDVLPHPFHRAAVLHGTIHVVAVARVVQHECTTLDHVLSVIARNWPLGNRWQPYSACIVFRSLARLFL